MTNLPAGRVDFNHPAGNIQQPICEDRLTVSRQRLTRLRDIAGSVAAQADENSWVPGLTGQEAQKVLSDGRYADGVADVLSYLIDRRQLDPELADLLDIEE